MTTEQPEALQRYKIGYRTDEWGTRSSTPSGLPDADGQWVRYADAVALQQGYNAARLEIDLQHTRIAELEAQLEAIGAGGVEPLRKISEQPAAGQEPVAYRYKDARGHWRYVGAPLTEGWDFPQNLNHEPLFAAPQPAVAAGWIKVSDRLPEPCQPVLLDLGKKYPIRALWTPKFTLPVSLEDESDFGEYAEAKDDYFCPEGWYEWNQQEETHWAVTDKPIAWRELPAPSTEGESNG